jgi:hypothetical protein
MTKVKVFEKKVKDQWIKVMVSWKRRPNSKVKGHKVKVSNERSCQKEYTCEI